MSTVWTKESMPDCSGKTVVITGASSGIGLETAIAMAEKNATVVLAVRNMEKVRRFSPRSKQATLMFV